MFDEIVRVALATVVSVENLESFLLETARYEAGRNLALSLSNQKTNPTKIRELIDRYVTLVEAESIEEGERAEGVEVFDKVDITVITKDTYVAGRRMKIAPESLNNKLRGGMLPGHHMVIFARPEAGKTAQAVTIACGALRQGFKGIYFGNEDPAVEIISRIVCNLSGMTVDEVEADPELAQERATANGLGLLTFVALSPGTLKQIDQFVAEYDPEWIVVDQVKNLAMGAENKVIQLEMAASGVRNIGKKRGVRVVSTTQAGDSAEFKAVLDMGDVDFSNTGIPGACDVLLGIGATRDMLLTDERMLSLSKNKIGGDHSSIPVRLNRHLSKVEKI